jgi:hypothetical protein
MARDRSQKQFFTVGIPHDSEALRALQADSKETGISIPLLIAARIADWYKLAAEGNLVTLAAQPGNGSGNGANRKAKASANAQDALLTQALGNAGAAALAWGGPDED